MVKSETHQDVKTLISNPSLTQHYMKIRVRDAMIKKSKCEIIQFSVPRTVGIWVPIRQFASRIYLSLPVSLLSHNVAVVLWQLIQTKLCLAWKTPKLKFQNTRFSDSSLRSQDFKTHRKDTVRDRSFFKDHSIPILTCAIFATLFFLWGERRSLFYNTHNKAQQHYNLLL